MAGCADPGKGFNRWLKRAAPWTFDAALLFVQGLIVLYVTFILVMRALFFPRPGWMPTWWILDASSAFHEWLHSSLPAWTISWLPTVELLSFVSLYVASYAWLLSKLSGGTLGQQLFKRTSDKAPRHRTARNVLALFAHNTFAHVLAWSALGLGP
jgi:hypothetical protein